MHPIVWKVVAVFGLVIFGVPAFAQPAISISTGEDGKSRTFLAGQLSISADINGVETKAFVCALSQPLKKGDTVAAMTASDQAWSTTKTTLEVGNRKVEYPILGMVKVSDHVHSLFPGIVKLKIDVKSGETATVEGYQIEAERDIKAGESIPVLLVGDDSLLSVEQGDDAKDKKDAKPKDKKHAKPWFTAHKVGTKDDERARYVEAWRVEIERANP